MSIFDNKKSKAKCISAMVIMTLLFSLWTITPVYAETVSSPDGACSVDISATTVNAGQKITFTAHGLNQDVTVGHDGDVRYVPYHYIFLGPQTAASDWFSNNDYSGSRSFAPGEYRLEVTFEKSTYRGEEGLGGSWEIEFEHPKITIPINVEKVTNVGDLSKNVEIPVTTVTAGQQIVFTAKTRSDTGVRYIPYEWSYENKTYPETGNAKNGGLFSSSYNKKIDTDFPGKCELTVTFTQEMQAGDSWVQGDSYPVVIPLTVKPRPANLIFVSGFDQSSIKDVERKIYLGEPYGALPKFKAKGWKLLGFYTDDYGGVKVTATTIAKHSIKDEDGNYDPGTITVYAHWSKKVKVKFKASGAKIKGKKSKVVEYNENEYKEYGKLPTATKAGYKFLGWYTKKKGGEKVTKSTSMMEWDNHTLYAHWFGPKGSGSTITRAEFKRIKLGMSYSTVKYLVGGKGQLKYDGPLGKMYKWNTSGGGYAAIWFDGGEVDSKHWFS